MAAKPGRRFGQWRAAHLRLGERGERLACRLLTELGLEVVARNFSGPHGELDIVARDGAMLCFVEVRSRHRSKWVTARPAHTVNTAKKRHIIHTALHYLRQLGQPRLAYRYDVVEIIFDRRRLVEARYWPAEFTSSDLRPRPDDATNLDW